ncbi:MAG: adenylate/guanylate cyclase domain-containing protein [Mesorhizobium sp.]|nr:MAG: adenylate/guanylate cyclase domain-containing protein [Mesorhizobium sp.]TIS89617.1 MAG: adenylate/guanylate cyclase domain-containing protein [Mesorhizobium sp.]
MIADVVGYGRLSQTDEEGTRALFRTDLNEVFEPRIAAHHGRLVKTMGDGILVEFHSVVDALRCAVEIQQQKAEVNVLTQPERRLDFRIGINLGDVIVEGDDIHGDAVNIADRLQVLAEPGGIAISATACDHVKGKLPIGFASLGEQKMKSIAEPVRMYRVLIDPATAGKIVGAKPGLSAGDDSKPPVIAVLRFENLSADDGWTRLVDGLSADMIGDLARYPDLAVISRQTMQSYRGRASDSRSVGLELNADYLLEGTLQAIGQRVRVAVQLVDALTGANLWSARFEESLSTRGGTARQIHDRCEGRSHTHAVPRRGTRPRLRAGLDDVGIGTYGRCLQCLHARFSRFGRALARMRGKGSGARPCRSDDAPLHGRSSRL